MAARFNPAPGWPQPEPGWVPPPGWTWPREWAVPPAGWCFWVDEETGKPARPPSGQPGSVRPWFRRMHILLPTALAGVLLVAGVAGAGQSGPVGPGASQAPSVSATAPDEAALRAADEAEAEASAAAREVLAAQARESEAAVAAAKAELAAAEREAHRELERETERESERAQAEREAAERAAAERERAELHAAEQAAAAAAATWLVTNIVDGDTIDVERAGVTERVRVLGIDTPEQGECGFEASSTAMGAVVGGKQVVLGVAGRDERDRYDRLIAYVDTPDGTDAGLVLIEDGMAIARYDSRDGYGAHPREAAYVAADDATAVAYGCDEPVAPVPAPAPPASTPRVGLEAGPFANCAAVRAAGRDPIRLGEPGFESTFDGDGDGVGCE